MSQTRGSSGSLRSPWMEWSWTRKYLRQEKGRESAFAWIVLAKIYSWWRDRRRGLHNCRAASISGRSGVWSWWRNPGQFVDSCVMKGVRVQWSLSVRHDLSHALRSVAPFLLGYSRRDGPGSLQGAPHSIQAFFPCPPFSSLHTWNLSRGILSLTWKHITFYLAFC